MFRDNLVIVINSFKIKSEKRLTKKKNERKNIDYNKTISVRPLKVGFLSISLFVSVFYALSLYLYLSLSLQFYFMCVQRFWSCRAI